MILGPGLYGNAFATPAARQAERNTIAAHTRAFLARGGEISRLPTSMTPEQRDAEMKRGWTDSLGTLSSAARIRKQGEFTVSPEWEYRPNRRPVRITRDGEVREFTSCAKAAAFLGVTGQTVGRAVSHGWLVRGWKAEFVR